MRETASSSIVASNANLAPAALNSSGNVDVPPNESAARYCRTAFGWSLRASPDVLLWFRTVALILPPLVGVAVIIRRRRLWWGCQWFFWATIAIGLLISALGFVGWTVDEILSARGTSWLGWPAVFALFGSVAPLFALLALPHRGVRESSAATTAVDIAGIAVLAGFLYSYVVMASRGPARLPPAPRCRSSSFPSCSSC